MKPELLIVGAGAYVCGSGADDFGTVLPSAIELQRQGRIGRIRIAASRPQSVAGCRRKLAQLGELLDWAPDAELYPRGSQTDANAYLAALAESSAACAAIVVVPDSLHHRIAGSLIDRGVDCLVVKPLAATLTEARDLARRARAAGVVAQVEFHKRFDEANRLLRREIGSLGPISSVLVEYSQRRSQPLETFKRWAHESQPFQFLAVHYVDLIHFVTGATPLRAMAVGSRCLLASKGVETFDSVQALVEWKSLTGDRFVSVFATSWIDPEASTAMSNQIIKVIGTEGRFDSDQKNRGVELTTSRGHQALNPYFSQLLPDGNRLKMEGYGPRSIATFIEAVAARLAGKRVDSDAASFDDALVSSAVCDAVRLSLDDAGSWHPVWSEAGRAARPRLRSSTHEIARNDC